MSNKIAVIGGGAAGMMAASIAVKLGSEVILFEKNNKLGKKLAITGKGRCNITNNCSPDEFMRNVPVNPKFLYTAINNFTPNDTIDFFESAGVKLKTERGNRVFPVSDNAFDIVDAMRRLCKCKIVKENVENLIINNNKIVGLTTNNTEYKFDKVIVCTGGKSYPLTGSTGDGYRFAKQAGLEVTPLSPSLVPIEVIEPWCKELQGLSLKNVSVSVTDNYSGKSIFNDFGEMLFTHFGLSGPMILSASAHMSNIVDGKYNVIIDLKPALDEKTLDNRLLSDFNKYINKNFSNALDDLLPKKMIPVIIKLVGIDSYKKVNTITQEERRTLLNTIKRLKLTVKGFRPIDEAIVTSGGVAVGELNPRTMESKKVAGLYFAGEVIDIDAYTGGFNLQIAFSTAYIAAVAACSCNLRE